MSDQVTYATGIKHCRSCGKPLGEITCSKYRNWFTCGRPECNQPKVKLVAIQFLPDGKLCDAEGCTKLAERRAYPVHVKRFYCSDLCNRNDHLRLRGAVAARCHHCGADLGLRKPKKSGLHFCYGHEAAYRHEQSVKMQCGRFLDPYKAYESFALSHYGDGNVVAWHIRSFLAFLNQETNLTNISDVKVDHIGQYIGREKERSIRPRVDFIRVFFDQLRLKGFYSQTNPVRPSIHYKKERRNEPRVYTDREITEQVAILERRGDIQARAIYFICFECGPTMAEVCGLQLSDVDFEKCLLRFRNQDGNSDVVPYSHVVPFGKETGTWLSKWLEKRPKDSGHEFVFSNRDGDPMTTWALRDFMNAALLRESKFRTYAEGMERFSIDMLRRTNIWKYKSKDLEDSINMRIHGIRAVATLKRYAKIMTEGELEAYRRAVEE